MAGARAIRASNFVLRLLQLSVSVIILGVFSYFLAVLADHGIPTERWIKAVEGIAGGATFYALLASLFSLRFGGVPFFARLGMMLDFAFTAAFIAIAIMARNGTESCTGFVHTPIGNGEADQPAAGYGPGGFGTGDGKQLTYLPSLRSACRLLKGVFAVSIIGIFLFLVSIIAQHLYMHHRSEIKTAKTGRLNLRSVLRFPRRRRTLGPRATVVDFNQANGGEDGTIPLSEQPSTEKTSPHARVFGRGVNSSDTNNLAEPQLAARPEDASGSSNNHPNTYGYGHSNPYSYGHSAQKIGNDDNPYTRGNPYGTDAWSTPDDPSYNYNQSGVGDFGYAFGYGDARSGSAPYTARAGEARSY
ncbi:hypothetical protein PRK78_004625 [Emydomyces testavorans]|uniref:MARVEL domain-containing protein n=1 Tax=Emydomyces testavorans TaxID=2070801 RepID=A0AAF0IJY2_9EURO|nr:hypothetical protein PRK78_004625 [Emydomyces testavorans]